MEWSDGRRLTAVFFDDLGDLVYYSYDNSGLRTDKRGPRVYDCNYAHTQDLFYVDYYYDDNGTLVYERRSESGDNASTYFTIEYFYGLNGITGFTVLNGTSSTTYYYVKNILGDVLGITDSNGTLVAEYRYDAYGKPVKILDGNGNDVSTNYAHIANINPIRYRGYYYDIETGFYYVSSRYYDPEIGRWINADGQISGVGGEILGYNMFAYCFNNPVNMSDPTGNWPKFLEEIGSRFVHSVKIMGRIAASPFKAMTVKLGAGVGIGAKATFDIKSVPVEVGAVTSITDSVSYEKGKFDVRNTTSTIVGINISQVFDFSYTKGYEHSYFDDNCSCDFMSSTFGQKSHCIANQNFVSNDANFGVSLGAYLLVGGEVSISVDLKAWNDELISIFYESMSYGQ